MNSIKKLIQPALGLALACSAATQASVLDPLGWYNDENHAGWTCRSMIDFDQRRETGKFVNGLPGDGRKHCGPSATANLLAWFATYHEPGLAPGAGDWQSDLYYDQATDFIEELGVEMDCCGVGSVDVHDSLVSRLDPDRYTVVTRVRDDDESPNFRSLLEASLAGGMSVFAYYRYDETGEFAEDGIPIRVRDGGHLVTLRDIRINGDDRRIRVRNPWTKDPESHFSQSTFSCTEYFPAENTFYRRRDDGELRGPYTMSQLFYEDQEETNKHLDWTSTVYPSWGLTVISHQVQVVIADPENSHWEPIGVPPEPKLQIIDFGGLEALRWVWVLDTMGSGGSLRRVNLTSGQSTTFEHLEFTDPRSLAMDDRGSMWVVDGSSVVRIDGLETDPRIGYVREIPGAPIRSLNWDAYNRSLVALNEDSSEVVILKLIEYGFIADHRPLPEGSSIGAKARIAAHNDGSGWWIADPDSGLWFLDGDPDRPLQQMQHPELGMPTDVQMTDGGTIVVSDNGTLAAFSRDADGQLHRNEKHFLDGKTTGDRIMLARNHTNWDPDFHDEPSWELMTPPEDLVEVMDCLADVDLDQSVDVTDLLILLSDWNKDASPADLNGDAAVNVMDLLVILEGWGPCPTF
ncbi:MAG: hypothetical protein P8K80_05095 [Phycisphaerales bacterium]|nr:hypothetical protein [Phycisphaerales bacterium]